MNTDEFVTKLTAHADLFAKAVSTNENEWIVKGFIDVYQKIYSISVDTKIVSKVLELLLFPMLKRFAEAEGFQVELCQKQNHYPDLTFVHLDSGNKFAVDIKSTYRTSDTMVNGMTLGAYTGYFRSRDSNKNILYPYGDYTAHIVLGVIYSKCDEAADERNTFELAELENIPSVVKDFQFFVQPKFRIASAQIGSGNTRNIGAVKKIDDLINGTGPFSVLGEEIYDDFWMFYLNKDMANKAKVPQPYSNLKTYAAYKTQNTEALKLHKKEIDKLVEEEVEEEDE